LAFHFRIEADSARETFRRHVDELLDNAGMLTAAGDLADTTHPDRAKRRLEEAFERLRTDQVIDVWQYDREPPLPSKQWVGEWRRWTVVLEPPATLRARYVARGLGRLALPERADLG
jgi:hypothetical protein